jgi:hypothetical protein
MPTSTTGGPASSRLAQTPWIPARPRIVSHSHPHPHPSRRTEAGRSAVAVQEENLVRGARGGRDAGWLMCVRSGWCTVLLYKGSVTLMRSCICIPRLRFPFLSPLTRRIYVTGISNQHFRCRASISCLLLVSACCACTVYTTTVLYCTSTLYPYGTVQYIHQHAIGSIGFPPFLACADASASITSPLWPLAAHDWRIACMKMPCSALWRLAALDTSSNLSRTARRG